MDYRSYLATEITCPVCGAANHFQVCSPAPLLADHVWLPLPPNYGGSYRCHACSHPLNRFTERYWHIFRELPGVFDQ